MAWGKWGNDAGSHRLEHHCADVAAVFEALLTLPNVVRRLARLAGTEAFDVVTTTRLTCLVYLHDFGKLNAGFQFKVREPRPRLAPPPAGHVEPGGQALEGAAPNVCRALGFADVARWGAATEALLRASLAHHGRPARLLAGPGGLTRDVPHRDRVIWEAVAEPTYDPVEEATGFAAAMRTWFPDAFEAGPDLPDATAFQHLFAGLVSLADWIGSDEEAFPFVAEFSPDYIASARDRAGKAIGALGLKVEEQRAGAGAVVFGHIFGLPGGVEPNAMQNAIGEVSDDDRLVILESETGSGKTEAAFLRFADLYRAGLVDGLYFAVPTRAAAVQLHGRIHRATRRWFGDRAPETVLAVPGYLKAGGAKGHKLPDWKVLWEDDPDDRTRMARWAAESAKRYLAAQVAVGTVDQAMLSGLTVKHAHLRAASLSRNLLVVDEVHASDPWMRAILAQVIDNHLAAGGHALLMSATLGSAVREAWRKVSPLSLDDAAAVPYPSISTETRIGAVGHNGRDKVVHMTLVPEMDDAAAIAARALAKARGGARVLVIRNTVDAALAVQSALENAVDEGEAGLLFACKDVTTVHHSRFAAEDRRLLDDTVEQTLGKSRETGGKIVIGTQTLEQSLDIDADYLITDLCPVDVLLQRIGRLHRHARDDRPPEAREPAALILAPGDDLSNLLKRGRNGLGGAGGRGVYPDLRIIEATRRLIAGEPVWRIPEMNRRLVEAATHCEALAAIEAELGGEWAAHGREIAGIAAADGQVAGLYLLDWTQNFSQLAFPDISEVIRTRLGEDDRLVEFGNGELGPFGEPITRLAIRSHLVRDVPLDAEAQIAPGDDGALAIRLGERAFRYDRLGLQPFHEAHNA